MWGIRSIPINQKRLVLFVFLFFSSPAFANCPSGYQEIKIYATREFKVRWEYDREYSTCLSINYPEKNNRRGSYGLDNYNHDYQCGTIHLAEFSFGKLYVQPSNKSLKPVFFQGPYGGGGHTDRNWCEQVGEDINCYEEQVWSDRYFPVQLLEPGQNQFIYSKDIRRTIRECKVIRF